MMSSNSMFVIFICTRLFVCIVQHIPLHRREENKKKKLNSTEAKNNSKTENECWIRIYVWFIKITKKKRKEKKSLQTEFCLLFYIK